MGCRYSYRLEASEDGLISELADRLNCSKGQIIGAAVCLLVNNNLDDIREYVDAYISQNGFIEEISNHLYCAGGAR